MKTIKFIAGGRSSMLAAATIACALAIAPNVKLVKRQPKKDWEKRIYKKGKEKFK